MNVRITSDIVMEFGRNFHSVVLIIKPSKTKITMLKPTLRVNLSIWDICLFPGNRADMNAYPGMKNMSSSAKPILRGVSLKGEIRIKTIERRDRISMNIRSRVYKFFLGFSICSLCPVLLGEVLSIPFMIFIILPGNRNILLKYICMDCYSKHLYLFTEL